MKIKKIENIDGLPWNIVDFSSAADKRNKKQKTDFHFSDNNIIISNAQWLMLHGDELPYTDCIIQDECIKPGQLVKTISGYKKIEDINVGEFVYSYNTLTGIYEYKKVESIHKNLYTSTSYSTYIRIELNNNNTLIVTPNHKIYTENNGYVCAENLASNDTILILDNLNIKIKSIIEIPRNNEDVYNLTVKDNHNYFVNNILVSNCHGIKRGAEISKLVKGVNIPYKFGCTGTLPKKVEDQWNIAGIFGPIVDEIKIQELQKNGVLADVNINPIKFNHILKENFRNINHSDEDVEDAFEIAQQEYKNEAMYLSQYEPTNKIITNMAKGVIKQHEDWNVLILFDYTLAGESLYNLLDFENKHYIDGNVKLEVRQDIVTSMNDPSGGHITVANCKCFGTGITVKHIQCIFIVTSQSSVTKIIQAIGRGLRIEEKPILHIFDIFHNYKYSEKHFKERVELYKSFYNKELNKDFKVKNISL